jgi:hypothetical protein
LAATINRQALRTNLARAGWWSILVSLFEAAVVLALARQAGWWPVAAGAVLAVELWALRPGRRVSQEARTKHMLDRLPMLLVGLSVVLIIALSPRAITQVAVAGLYAVWRVWWSGEGSDRPAGLTNLLVMQAVVFEALFLMAAVWRTPNVLVIALVWLGAYLSVYTVLARRGDRVAGVMAATWALVAAQISWVLLWWLFTYTLGGGYILVPQPALILTALAYCFGSIYVSQRAGSLSRGRLTEYLLIGLILIAVVVIGTSWRGTV